MKGKTTDKQRMFIENYLTNGYQAKLAAIQAGYSEKTADVQGCQLLKDPKVKAELDLRRAQLAEKFDLTKEYMVKEYLSVIQDAKLGNNPKDRANIVAALAHLTKLCGLDTPIKIDVTNKELVQILYVTPEDTLSLDDYTEILPD